MKKATALLLTLVMLLSVLPAAVFAADGGTKCMISVQSTEAMSGDTVAVDVVITGNPGIQGATLKLTWDSALILKSAANGEAFSMLNLTLPGNLVSGRSFVWYREAPLSNAEIKDGTVLTLTFAVSEQADEGREYAIGVSYVEGDIFDSGLRPVNPATENGGVKTACFLIAKAEH